MSQEKIVWKSRRNGAYVVEERGRFIPMTGYGICNDPPQDTLQAARTLAGAYPPWSAYRM